MERTNPIGHLNKRQTAVAYVFFLAATSPPQSGNPTIDNALIREASMKAAAALLHLGVTEDELQEGLDNAAKVLNS